MIDTSLKPVLSILAHIVFRVSSKEWLFFDVVCVQVYLDQMFPWYIRRVMFLCFYFCLPRVLTLNDLPWKLPSQHLCPESVQIFNMLIFSFVFHSFFLGAFHSCSKGKIGFQMPPNVSTNQCEHNIPTYYKKHHSVPVLLRHITMYRRDGKIGFTHFLR